MLVSCFLFVNNDAKRGTIFQIDQQIQSYAIVAEQEMQTDEKELKSRSVQTPVQVFDDAEVQCDEVCTEKFFKILFFGIFSLNFCSLKKTHSFYLFEFFYLLQTHFSCFLHFLHFFDFSFKSICLHFTDYFF